MIIYCVENNGNLHKFKKILICNCNFVTKIDIGSKEHDLNVSITDKSDLCNCLE